MGNFIKTPTVFQMEATECGAASLSMIFAFYGKHLPLEQLRIETGVSRDGCNAGNIVRTARKHGFECHGYHKEPEDLKSISTPCIIHWNFNHFVVFEGFKGKYAYINDPAVGQRRLSYEELDDCFTGVVLTFKPEGTFEKKKKKRPVIHYALRLLRGQSAVICKLFLVGILLVFPGLLIPVLAQLFIDEILIAGNIEWLRKLVAVLVAAVLLQSGLIIYRNWIMTKLQKKMVLLSSREYLHHLFRLPISFFDQRYIGDISSRTAGNARISDFLAGDLAETAFNLLTTIGYFVLLLIYSPVLTAVAVIALTINMLLLGIAAEKMRDSSNKLQLDLGKLTGVVCAGLSITGTLKASGAENEYISRILGYNAKTIAVEQKMNQSQRILNAVPEAVKMLGEVSILVIGACMVIKGRMTVGMLVAFSLIFGLFSEPIERLVGLVKAIQTTRADIIHVEDIMHYEADSKFEESLKRSEMTTKLDGAVEVRAVSFGYSKLKSPLVQDFSCKIGCGESLALVGSSGCGKSTVAKIISGLYEPWTGTVLFNGVSAKEIPGKVLNASISTVSQNTSLFSGSIRDNLTLWNQNISERDLIAAAKDAGIHDLITQLPGAYDYILAEGAKNLSGGQRQKMEIARALVTNPTILIMDEATSSLDPIAEKTIMDNIKRRGCTCVVVSHRLSAIRDCNQIIVLESGRILQSGTHEELLRTEGHYKQMVQNL